jgi:uncharacterized surface protein with fasciclin (FAS1) repeats
MMTRPCRTVLAGMMLVAAVGLSACSGDDDSAATPDAGGQSKAGAMSAAGLVGPGCAAYATQVPTGAGSVAGMADDPLVTAAGHNPMLNQLTAAVSGKLNPAVDLANSLNGKDYTVFAPVDAAFRKLPAAELASLRTDQDALTGLLTYHVLAGQIAPNAIAGKQTTVESHTLTVTGAGNSLKVNGAQVICGGIRTANATVYLIDTVLRPPKS